MLLLEISSEHGTGGASSRCVRIHPGPPDPDLRLPRIYVYELPDKFHRELTHKYRRCSSDQYGTEVFFHEALLQYSGRTTDPDAADFFFVPIYGECFLWSWEMLRKETREKSFDNTNKFFLEALAVVKQQFPYWNRTEGRDHIFSFPGARGPTIFEEWESQIKRSIFLTPEGDRKATYFNTWKDIVVPGLEADPTFHSPQSHARLVERKGEDHLRPHLAYFRGTIDHREGWAYSKGLRPRLKAVFANETDIIYGPKRKDCDRQCYHEEMSASVFCLNPLGWTPWTLRFYQAVMTRCIPILIADDIEFPYENELDYSKFAVKMRENDVDGIVTFMRNMPEEERARRREEMDRLWLAFTYQWPPVPGDAFHMTMRELSRKIRKFKTSSSERWL
eukprot:jgi/Mesvir1/18827/Mv11428-RA.1